LKNKTQIKTNKELYDTNKEFDLIYGGLAYKEFVQIIEKQQQSYTNT
jgi:hypothetical protein